MNPGDVEHIYELSPMQQAMLFHSLYAPGSGVYVLQQNLRLTGRLDLPTFERAWRLLVERQDVLRTAFFWEDLEKPLQVVYRQAELEVTRESWLHLGADEQRARLASCLEDDRRRGFDLSAPPLMRLALFELAPEVHQLVWTVHHIVIDGWSQGLVLQELFAAYSSLAAGREPALAPPRAFRDYIAWLQRQPLDEAEAFWRRSLAGFTSPTFMAGGEGRPDEAGGRESRRRELPLPSETTAALREMARRRRLTVNTLAQGAWALMLAQASGREDVVFGATVAGRPADLPGVESIVGLFINTLPMRVEVRPEDRLWEWLAGIQARQAESRRYEHSPLVEVQRWSQLPAGVALFDHILVFENLMVPGEVSGLLPELEIREEEASTRTNYPLNVVVIPRGELALSMIYDSGRFEAVEVTRMLERLAALLTAFATDCDPQLGELPALLPAELQQVLVEWNDTAAEDPGETCLHELFAAQALRTPQAVALVHGSRAWTYAELAARVGGLALRLRSLGVGPEVRAAVCLERSPDLVASLLAVLAAGGAYVPIDPAYPADRRAFMLEDSGAAVLVTRGPLAADLPATGARTLDLDAEEIPPAGAWPAPSGTTPGNLAYIIYTSGSTGRPKGVAIEHRSAVTLACWARGEFSDEELSGVLVSTSVCFDVSVFEIFAPLAWGGRLILAENALELPSLPLANEVRLATMVPSAANELARTGGIPPSVRIVGLGGEPVPGALVSRLYATGSVERVLNMYGPSEDTTYSTVGCIPDDGRTPGIGRPVRGARAHVVDPHGALVPPGVAGELWLAGAGLARGYLNRPGLTAERFTPDRFSGAAGGSAGGRVYRTGDLVRLRPDGELEFLSRIDHQIKLRGFRIELGEIEAVLAAHPDVLECAVLVREDTPGARLLVAYLAGREGTAPENGELRSWLAAKLPEYMVPALFVRLEALPRTPNGKVDRKALPVPDRTGAEEYAEPSNPVEEQLARIWSEVLEIERVGVHDDFFALGGHSLLATRVLARIRQTFGVDLPLREVFRRPTVAGLAELIAARAMVPPDEGELASLLDEMDQLSDEEVQARLAELQLPEGVN